MKRRIGLMLCVCLLLVLFPLRVISEGEDTVLLARVLYTMCQGEDERTMMKVGSVILNRVDSPWFPDTLAEVLNQAQQFPCGRKYDARSMDAALRLLDGARSLPPEALFAQRLDASSPLEESDLLERTGGYGFYRMHP